MKPITRIFRYLRDPYGRAKLANFVRGVFVPKGRGRDEEAVGVSDLPGFWEQAHVDQKTLWLTGSHPQEVVDRLDVQAELVHKNQHVLDVGVGIGLMAKFLSDKGMVVSALDISVNALDRIKSFVTGSYNQASDLPDKTFGLVMHHLVAQHMSDADLVVQMRHLIRSLTPNGIVAMQFASTVLGQPSASNQSTGLQATGGVTRSPKEMEVLVGQAGGSVLSTTPREVFTQSQYRVVKFK
jgi:SAM-dependent methyltransferase